MRTILVMLMLFSCFLEARPQYSLGEIKIAGSIIEAPCYIDSDEKYFVFGNITARDIIAGNLDRIQIRASIELKGCTLESIDNPGVFYSKAHISFFGEEVQDDILKINGEASGFGVEFFDENRITIPINDGALSVAITEGTMRVPIIAKLVTTASLSNAVLSGDFNAIVRLRLEYE